MENIKDKEKKEIELEIKEAKTMPLIIEGNAKIMIEAKVNLSNKEENYQAFYNPVQMFNRDITVLVLKVYGDMLKQKYETFNGLKILDALSGCGIRAIRFLKELDNVQFVVANDLYENMTHLIERNVNINQIDLTKIKILSKDANKLMYNAKEKAEKGEWYYKFDYIDLDPFGGCIPFLDSAIKCIKNDGLIGATFTDLRVLSGPDTQKCFYWYGSTRAKISANQENAIRIVLFSINSIANRHGKYIVPLVCYQSEFYLRLFFVVNTSKSECARTLMKLGHIFNCDTCSNFSIFPLGKIIECGSSIKYVPSKLKLDSGKCSQCEENYTINGPVWIDIINDLHFVRLLLQNITNEKNPFEFRTKKKMIGMLYGILYEGESHTNPYGFKFQVIAKFLKTNLPNKYVLMSAMKSLNYNIVPSYIQKDVWKSNATAEIFFDIIKAWKLHKVGKDRYYHKLEPHFPSHKSLSKQIKMNPNFEIREDVHKKEIPLFFPNPEKFWGPKKKPKKFFIQHLITNEKLKEEEKKEEKIIYNYK